MEQLQGGSRRFGGAAVALLFGVGLCLGVGARVAAADAPGIPIPKSPVAESPTSVRVLWEDRADDEQGFVIAVLVKGLEGRYDVVRTIGDPGDNIFVKAAIPGIVNPQIGGTGSWVVDGLTPRTEYCFKLRAWNVSRNLLSTEFVATSGWSGQRCTTTLAELAPSVTPPPPAPPSQVRVTATAMGAQLTWVSTDPSVTGFEVKRQINGVFRPLTDFKLPFHTRSYSDSTPASELAPLVYQVCAWNDGGPSCVLGSLRSALETPPVVCLRCPQR